MKKKLLFIANIVLAITINATETISYHGEILNLKLSNDSWNRIIFDSDINAEPIFSKEKNVDIYKANKSVFIKFKPVLKVEIQDKQEQILDIDYSNSKTSELFISTVDGTYSFTIEPKPVSAKTYFIQNIQNKNKNILKFEMDSTRKIAKEIIKNIFLNEAIENYDKLKVNPKALNINNMLITPKFVFKGKIYSAYLYDVIALDDIKNIDEKLFLNLTVKNKKAISIKDKSLMKNHKTSLVILVGN
ncbi:MAG: type-F conjugative transfer system secretin TraK [Arcobacteraceae bacterium]